MTIKQRLAALIASFIAILLLLSGTLYFEMRKVYDAANYANTHSVPSLILINDANSTFLRLRSDVYAHVVATDPRAKIEIEKQIGESFKALSDTLGKYEKHVDSDEDRRLTNSLKEKLVRYQNDLEVILVPSRNYMTEDAQREIMNARPTGVALSELFDKLTKYNEASGKRHAEEAAIVMGRTTLINIGFLAAAIAVSLIVGIGIVRSITRRVQEANAIAGRIAGGDLSANASVGSRSRDELGQLLVSLDKMRNDLSTTIQGVVAGAEEVVSAATQLAGAAQQVAQSSEEQTAATASAAAAVEEMTVSIDHIGTSAQEANERAVAAGELATRSGDEVDTATTQITRVAEQVQQTAKALQSLSEQVAQIGNITTVIREVAEQTNLLALNAAIEAARAGEQGRGFAVVADEVRKLAERTTASVQEISGVVVAIQSGAEQAVGSMQTSRGVVSEVVITANHASASMQEIRRASDTVRHSVESIAGALREQKTTSTDLARNVESIAQLSDENAQAVDSVAGTAKHLAALSAGLKASVERFRL